MRLSLFKKPYKLDFMQVETLKVALLDAQKQMAYERGLLSDDDKQLIPTIQKINRFNALIEYLDLQDVCMQDPD